VTDVDEEESTKALNEMWSILESLYTYAHRKPEHENDTPEKRASGTVMKIAQMLNKHGANITIPPGWAQQRFDQEHPKPEEPAWVIAKARAMGLIK
jgi:hypothetical protein